MDGIDLWLQLSRLQLKCAFPDTKLGERDLARLPQIWFTSKYFDRIAEEISRSSA